MLHGVANGYQLWYARNDWRSLLVYCGRSVECGRCAESSKSAPKSSKKGAKSTKTGGKFSKSAGKSTKSTGKSVKSGTKMDDLKAILLQRSKPIITMLEDIRIYIMQRLVAMNKLAVNLEDQITPTVRKRLEYLKREQRNWYVFPSAYEELEKDYVSKSSGRLETCSLACHDVLYNVVEVMKHVAMNLVSQLESGRFNLRRISLTGFHQK
ncbi:hypothetical protein Tco_0954752 [Tanacetum coccineum]|uniref:Uncharacterized protein n=1 Tax=Tanacetum coccineum TaxID=301880 RepID=A0ABQ5E587_9ASTR